MSLQKRGEPTPALADAPQSTGHCRSRDVGRIVAVAVGLDLSPLMLAVPATLAASMAVMMPVATAPNAIVFSRGDLKIIDMVRAGFFLNLVGIAVATLIVYFIYAPIFGW